MRRLAAPPVFAAQFPLLARRPKVIEAWERAWERPGRAARETAIPVGSRVFHQKFGYGVVTAAEDDRLDIAFEKTGAKRVLDRYVEKA